LSAERSQLEKNHALFVRRLISRFPQDDPKARVVLQAWELRENGLTPAKLIERLGGRWEVEHNARQDYCVFRRPRALRELTPMPDEPEGRWLSREAC
jgi:hypothetical protein